MNGALTSYDIDSVFTGVELVGGHDYQFKIYAVNKYGNGEEQTLPVTITTGHAPDTPNAPTTNVPPNSVYVEIDWTGPNDNNFDID